MNKEYLLAVDGYTMVGDGYNSNTFVLSDNELFALKDKEETKVFNIENFVGGGEAVEYDLLEYPKGLKVLTLYTVKKGDNLTITAMTSKYIEDKDNIEQVIKDLYSDRPNYNLTIEVKELIIVDTLGGLKNTVAENDFAHNYIKDKEGTDFIQAFLDGKEEKVCDVGFTPVEW